MKISSCKLRSLAVLLLLLEFLTPAVLTDLLFDETSSDVQANGLQFDLKKQKSPVPFVIEGTDTEEEQREAQHQKTLDLNIQPEVVAPRLEFAFIHSTWLQMPPIGERYATHPPTIRPKRQFPDLGGANLPLK